MSPITLDRAVLRRAEMFTALSDEECDALALFLRARQFAANEVLFRQGEPGTTMLIVGSGTLAALIRRSDGADEEINQMGPGETVGEMAFIDPAPRSATVVARTDAIVYELGHDAMATLRREVPAAAAAIVGAVIRDVTRRLRLIDQRIEEELGARAELGEPLPAAVVSTMPPRRPSGTPSGGQ